MLMFGKNITQAQDKLEKNTTKFLYDKITNPDNDFMILINSLNSLAVIEPSKYAKMKKRLPYVVPSIFTPPYRKKANFASSDQIILDLDHLTDAGLEPEKIKDKLSKDPRVELIFISPSHTGLKVFFKLKEKIFDAQLYSEFYKLFASEFARQYGLTQVIDIRTNDVTRACFLSYDTFAYFNENPKTIDYKNYIDEQDPIEIQNKIEQVEKEFPKKKEINPQGIDEDVLAKIKKKLNPEYKPRKPKQKNIFVPEELTIAEKKIKKKMEEAEINVVKVKNINYGKQFVFKYEEMVAEVNVYFGKKGFSIVKSNKTFNNKEFQEIIYQTLIDLLTD